MSELRDPLLDAIHVAGEVPPPPARDAAFARAMRPLLTPSRRRLNRSVIALFAAALLAVPAAVFAERASHTPSATIRPITFEKPDPGSSIQREADDSTVKRQSTATGEDEHSGSTAQTDERSASGSIQTDHSEDGTTVTDDNSGSGSSGGDDAISTPAPAPIPDATNGSDVPDGVSSGSLDGGSSGPN